MRCAAFALTACLSLPTAAFADEKADRVAAAALADAGVERLGQGDARTALDLFARATALFPAATFALYEARCLVSLGRLDEAELAYARAERGGDGPGSTLVQREAGSDARREHEALRRRRPAKAPAPALAPRPAAVETKPPPPPYDGASRRPPLSSLFALGVGAAGVTVGVVSGVVMLGRKRDLDEACPTGRCAASSADQLDAYRSARTVSMVAWGVGIVGLAAGAGLWLAAPRVDAPPSASVVMLFGPSSAAISGTF